MENNERYYNTHSSYGSTLCFVVLFDLNISIKNVFPIKMQHLSILKNWQSSTTALNVK